ncbi:MAG TPA: TIGR01777 family oxidoreductase [Candidatus Baltobacteraceae bacterium]|nr:TIGR01777 family oxidoreductase [Candidatus Baltobacteraceae bacterium]
MRIAIAGGSGFIGRHLAAALTGRGDGVVQISLRDPVEAAQKAAPCDAIVNLAGEPIAQRWNAEVKRRIMESRSALPARFLSELRSRGCAARTFVSASAIGYYGTSETGTFTEENGPGTDFLAGACVAWEQSAQYASTMGMRVAIVRTGIALGSDGGALAMLLPIFKSGAGGRVGSGKQWFSWVHIDDVVALYLLAIDRLEGAINATAPEPVRNRDFTQMLAHALHRPAALPVPAFVVKAALGEGAVTVLEGQRVLPERALRQGYTFRFTQLEPALQDLLS